MEYFDANTGEIISDSDDLFESEGSSYVTNKGSGREYFDASTGEIRYEEEAPSLRERGRKLTKEDILADPESVARMRQFMGHMYGERVSFVNSRFEEQSDDEMFETWQNSMRDFAGGNSITSGRYWVKTATAEDEQKSLIGDNLRMFDNMESGWKHDPLDMIRDYTRAVVIDPVNIATLGVGKVMATGGTKVASTALKAGLKQTTSVAAQKALVNQSLRAASLHGAKQAALYSIPDVVVNVGIDALNQGVRVGSGVQEQYSVGQAALAGAATPVLPMVLGSRASRAVQRSELVKGSILEGSAHILADMDLTKEGLMEVVKKNLPRPKANAAVRNLFKNTKGEEMFDIISWDKVKNELPAWHLERKSPPTDTDKLDLYFEQFFYGNRDGQGFVNFLIEEKIPFDPELFADAQGKGGTTAFLNSTVGLLDDDAIADLSDDFVKSFGEMKTPMPRTTDDFGKLYSKYVSDGGKAIEKSARANRYLMKEALEESAEAVKKQNALAEKRKSRFKAAQFTQGVYKRLLTSHPATMQANTLGWATIHGLNTVTDFTVGLMSLAEAGGKGLMGRTSEAKAAFTLGKNSMSAVLRRGMNILNWDDSIEAANKFLELDPKKAQALMHTRIGDSGIENSLEFFGLENNRIAYAANSIAEFTQKVSGVSLQDEWTKRLSLYSALDTAMLRKRGMTFAEFLRDPKSAKDMLDPKFQQEIYGWAVDRALEETASKTYSDYSPGFGWVKTTATAVESLSQTPGAGVLIPFGKFFNNTMKFTGDYTMFNAVRYWYLKRGGRAVDLSRKSQQELIANGIVGWTFIAAHAEQAMDRIEQGLSWNQDARPDGSVSDRTYDWPLSSFRMAGQILAHIRRDGKAPPELMEEAGKTILTQTFKDLSGSVGATYELTKAVLGGDPESLELGSKFVQESLARGISGATRPLDPINEVVKAIKGTGEAKERRTDWSGQAFRYIDSFLGIDEVLPSKQTAFGGTRDQDLGKTMFGARSVDNLGAAARVANSLGLTDWGTVRWDGDPALKNRMNSFLYEIVDLNTRAMLEDNPNWENMDYNTRKIKFMDVLKESREYARDRLASSMSGGDVSMRYYDKIAKLDKVSVRAIMDIYEVPGKLEDLVGDPSGWRQLDLLIPLIEDYKDSARRRR